MYAPGSALGYCLPGTFSTFGSQRCWWAVNTAMNVVNLFTSDLCFKLQRDMVQGYYLSTHIQMSILDGSF